MIGALVLQLMASG